MNSFSKREFQVLLELLKNGRISDQEIARRLDTSRPGIAKIRKKLEEESIILGYKPLINFQKIDLNVHVIIIYRWIDYSRQKELNNFKEFVKKLPEVVAFIEAGATGSKTNAIISIHKNLPETEKFIEKIKGQWKDNVDNIEVLISTLRGIAKPYLLVNPAMKTIENQLHSKLVLPTKRGLF